MQIRSLIKWKLVLSLVPGEVSVGTAAINVGPAKQICCEHVSFCAIYIHTESMKFWPMWMCQSVEITCSRRCLKLWKPQEINTSPNVSGTWNRFFSKKNVFLLQGSNNTQSLSEKGARLSLWLTRTNIGEVASDPHSWISALEQGAGAGFSLNFVSFAVERQSWQAQALPVLCGSRHMNLFYKCARDTLIQQLDHFQKTQSWISELTSSSLLLLSSKMKNSASRNQVMNAALGDIPWKHSLQMDKMK